MPKEHRPCSYTFQSRYLRWDEFPNREYSCPNAAAEGRDVCIAHTDTKDRTSEEEDAFASLIKRKVAENDYNFTGYFFPEDCTLFAHEILDGDAWFIAAHFGDNAWFDNTKFGGDAWFDRARFGDIARFARTRFRENASFSAARFAGLIDLSETVFEHKADFFGATVAPAGEFSFEMGKGHGASICRFAKQVCQNMGEYQEAGDWHYKERCHSLTAKWQEAKEQLRENARSWPGLPKALWAIIPVVLEWILIRGIFGYAEKPKRIAGIAGGVIFGSGVLYWLTKAVVLEEEPTGLFRSLYFSVVTFTTLGLGDIGPISDFGRFLVGLEAITGAFLMAAFIVTLARRWGRG